MLDQISAISGIAGKVYNPVTNLLDRMAEWKQLKNDVNTKLRLLYLECQRNIALLEALDLDTDRHDDVRTDDEDYLSMADCLEIEVLEMVFFEGKKNNRFFRLLKKQYRIDDEVEEGEPQKELGKESNLIKKAVYLFIRIDTLKKLAKLPNKGKALKNIRYRTRLKNIRSSLRYIVKVLGETKIIKELTG